MIKPGSISSAIVRHRRAQDVEESLSLGVHLGRLKEFYEVTMWPSSIHSSCHKPWPNVRGRRAAASANDEQTAAARRQVTSSEGEKG
jgi:hypothetical protein